MRSGLRALIPLAERSQCHCLSRLLGTLWLFDSRTRYTLEIRHFPCFSTKWVSQKAMQLKTRKTNMADSNWANENVKTCKIRRNLSACEVKTEIFSTQFNQFCRNLSELTNTNGAIFPDLPSISRCIYTIDVVVCHVPRLGLFDFLL